MTLGDVLMGGDPAAVGHRLVHDQDRASAGYIDDQARGFSLSKRGIDVCAILLHVAVKTAGRLPMTDQVAKTQPRLHHVRGQAIHLDVLPVHNGDALVRIEQQQALRHIAEGGVEPAVGVGKRAEGLVEHPERQGPDGEEQAEPEETAQQREQSGLAQQALQALRGLDRPDLRARHHDRTAADQQRRGELRSFAEHERAVGADDAFAQSIAVDVGLLKQFGKAYALIPPQRVVRVDVFRDQAGVEFRFEIEKVGRVDIANGEIADRQ